MNPINKFLKNSQLTGTERNENFRNTQDNLKRLNQLFTDSDIEKSINIAEKLLKSLQKHQIWSVKSEYTDFYGNIQKTIHPFIVYINTEIKEIENEKFARVNVISPFVEMAADDDEICNDNSIIGFPFILEHWNNQPILIDILDKYLGDYIAVNIHKSFINKTENNVIEMVQEQESEDYNTEPIHISNEIIEFRQIELSRAKFLNHSVISVLSFIENKH